MPKSQGGLFDVIPHPDFASNNLVYLSYAHGEPDANATRVSRATFDGSSLSDLEVIYEATPLKDTPVHYGGRIAFAPDGMLFVTVGERSDAPIREEAQDIQSGLGKVFRKETMDATHLPEFYQIEGIVTEPDATFDMLMGLCRTFFTAMGFPEVRFRPAYFPYTEPSMEIDVWYNDKWMELGGCGVFRPEVTEPLGVEHPVLAWGFGLERLAMMRLGLKDIRDLYISDVRWLKEQPLL